MIVAGTGHRPKDIEEPWGIVQLKARVKLEKAQPDLVITGMAEGFDLLMAAAAKELGLEVWTARPWTNHTAGKDWIDLYGEITDYAARTRVVVESETYPGHWCMHKRNEWMVDNATHVMAYWNGKETGGTVACIRYANKVGKPIANIFDDPPF